jgi:Cu(I)/Ag(I) efflux system periplasmic protein CusF
MTTLSSCSLAFAGFILLALPACASSPTNPGTGASATTSMGVDLGPSSRVPTTQIAMAGAGHEGHRMTSTPSPNVQSVHGGGSDAHATGTVNAVDPAQHKINLSHQPIPSLGWPAMTMEFPVAPSVDLSGIKAGSRVNFSLEKGKDGMYQVQSVQPAGGGQ